MAPDQDPVLRGGQQLSGKQIASLYLCSPPPNWTLRAVQARVMELATGSPYIHAALAYDGAVLDPSIDGDKFYPQSHYELHNDRWQVRVDVPVWPGIDLDRNTDTSPRPAWKTVLRWATLGLYKSRDCVSVIADQFRATGIKVPAWIVTPHDLAQWLQRNCNGSQLTLRHPHGTACRAGQAPAANVPALHGA